MAGDIVPIELGLPSGSVYTLWAPRWRDGEDEWQAFLGVEDALYGFESVAELAAFIRTDTGHDLYDHPSWPVFEELSANQFTPEEEDRYDLTRVPRVAAAPPTFATTRFLDDCITLVFALGDVCDAENITDYLEKHGEFDLLGSGDAPFRGRSGDKRWSRIGRLINGKWDEFLGTIDDLITVPDVDPRALELAESELTAVDENDVENDDELDTDDDLDMLYAAESGGDGTEDEDSEDQNSEYRDSDQDERGNDGGRPSEDYAFWENVGIDPIQIVVPGGTFYTLRCYVHDDPIFLGRDGRIRVFATPRALVQHLADNNDHDLARLSTYEPVIQAATGGYLEVLVTDDNVYVLTGLVEDLTGGTRAVDPDQLDMAVELLEDAADFCDDGSVEAALDATTRLGTLVAHIHDPHAPRPASGPPFVAESEQWRVLEHALEDRYLVHPDT